MLDHDGCEIRVSIAMIVGSTVSLSCPVIMMKICRKFVHIYSVIIRITFPELICLIPLCFH